MNEKIWPCKKCNTQRTVTGGVKKGTNGAYVWYESTGFLAFSKCRECINRERREEWGPMSKRKKGINRYELTPKGYIMRIYRNMKSRISGVQKEKYHLYKNKELLSKDDFYRWSLSSESPFHALFKKYIESNRDRRLAPSVDRINSEAGYNLDNMEWVTHSENSRRGSINRNLTTASQGVRLV